ncbi:hypothetical protein R5R35_014619 [Gryllus longicercus]|uniref:Uncharacterized protein n=1 Tax=Gryllus longicercus TaxID=2509291 RepID=A0AAN9Z594_9ORTH
MSLCSSCSRRSFPPSRYEIRLQAVFCQGVIAVSGAGGAAAMPLERALPPLKPQQRRLAAAGRGRGRERERARRGGAGAQR